MTDPAPPSCPLLPRRQLLAFGDELCVRDPRGRSRTPSLTPGPDGLSVHGPFVLRRRLLPTRARGVAFVDATGDANPIHRKGEVVPGAFVAAQFASLVEVLFPALRLERLRATFSGPSWYDRALRLSLRAEPTPEGLRFEGVARQDEREVASARLDARRAARTRLPLSLEALDGAWFLRVATFYEALGIAPDAYFHTPDGPDLSYPLAFLASLPSGSMVERFDGAGGLLSRLTLRFGAAPLPIDGPPEVGLELPRRIRTSFNKIVTAVKRGVRTAVEGTALVLPRGTVRGVLEEPPAAR